MIRSATRLLLLIIAAGVTSPVARASDSAPPLLPVPQTQPAARDQSPSPAQPAGFDSAAAADQSETVADPPAQLETVPWSDSRIELEPWQLLAIFLLTLALIATAAVFVYSRFLASRHPPIDDNVDGEWPVPPLVIPARLAPDGNERPVNDLRQSAVPAGSREPWARLTPAPMPGQALAGRPVLHATAVARAVPAAPEQGEMVDAGPIRFHRPPEGTLQLLPGRLEILSGNERQEEIRFVRVAGQDAVVTFGRSEGEPHLHVQLRSRTVSRLHASIRFQEGRWYIANLSRTNPVVLNSQPMSGADAIHVALDDGDHIEMGEVIFRFRSR